MKLQPMGFSSRLKVPLFNKYNFFLHPAWNWAGSLTVVGCIDIVSTMLFNIGIECGNLFDHNCNVITPHQKNIFVHYHEQTSMKKKKLEKINKNKTKLIHLSYAV